MSSIAGLLAFDAAMLARETFAGSCPASSAGLAPVSASRAAPLEKAAAMPSASHCGGMVEPGVRAEPVAGERGLIVRVKRGDEQCAGLVGVLGDAAHQRQHLGGGGDDELLPGLQVQAHVDHDAGEAVELFFEGQGGEGGRDEGGWRRQKT